MGDPSPISHHCCQLISLLRTVSALLSDRVTRGPDCPQRALCWLVVQLHGQPLPHLPSRATIQPQARE